VLGVAWASFPAHATSESPIAYLAATEGLWQVWVVGVEGGEGRQVTRSPSDKSRVSWFPDGRSLLVNTMNGELFRVDLATGADQIIGVPAPGRVDAVLSPDGSPIAFSFATAPGDDNDLWVMEVRGDGARKLLALPGLQLEPTWSRDGRWIYFVSSVTGPEREIWRVPTAGGALEKVSVLADYSFEIAAGPDGALAYSNNATGDYEIYVRSESGVARQLTESPGLDGHPSWSADGTELVFHSVRSGSPQVWHLRRDGGAARRVTDHPGGARNPVWLVGESER
jgi:TolB protein